MNKTNLLETPVALCFGMLAPMAPSKTLFSVSAVVLAARPTTNRVFDGTVKESGKKRMFI